MSKKKETKQIEKTYSIWSIEQSYGQDFDTFESALEECVDFALLHKWEASDFPKNWVITKNGKLIRTLTVDNFGSIRWICHG